MKDENGANATGNWLNYAPSSPGRIAVAAGLPAQGRRVLPTKPAVIGFNLTNELTYSTTNGYLDYSAWANTAWQRGFRSAGFPPSPRRAIGIGCRAGDWRNWQLFRQDQLNTYFNTSYTAATAGLTGSDDEILFHRHNWYAATEAFRPSRASISTRRCRTAPTSPAETSTA